MWHPDLIDVLADMFGLGTATPVADELPAVLTVRGHRLILNGESVRSEVLGLVRCYRIGLYLSSPARELSNVGIDAPKALRIDILQDRESARMSPQWLQDLQPNVTTSEREVLRIAYARLRSGDRLIVSYLPGDGTQVTLNDEVVLRSEGDRLMRAFLDRWLAPDSQSDRIKWGLLRGDA